MTKEITFTNTSAFEDMDKPQPATKFIPDWYKNMESYIGGVKKPGSGNDKTVATVKRCMPVLDAITAGYIITLPADVYVSLKDGMQYFEWSNFGLVEFHPVIQAPEHPLKNEHSYAKWMNPWSVKTPSGYSTLFVQPFHRSSVFTILPGIVDTDTYFAPVNFPFVIDDPKFEGLIPKGTPIAQCIPIKRDVWNTQLGKEKELKGIRNLMIAVHTQFFNKYKTMFWHRKEYK
jgi:hypothetical protein